MLGGGVNVKLVLEIKMDSEKRLSGRLNPECSISAAVLSVSGKGLSGTLNARPTLRGSLSPDEGLSTKLNVVTRTDAEVYDGDYEIVPSTDGETLPVNRKVMAHNIVFKAIPYYETSNEHGTTVYIGG